MDDQNMTQDPADDNGQAPVGGDDQNGSVGQEPEGEIAPPAPAMGGDEAPVTDEAPSTEEAPVTDEAPATEEPAA